MKSNIKFVQVGQTLDTESQEDVSNPIQIGNSPAADNYSNLEIQSQSQQSDDCVSSFTKCIKLHLITVIVSVCVVILILVLASLSLSSGSSGTISTRTTFEDFHITATKGAVASDSSTCSHMGVDILAKGGNAVDASITTALCLGVVSPMSSGIGGGCFIVFHNSSSGHNVFIDSREVAPAAATPTMFEKQPILAQDGGLAVAVLAEVHGLHLAYTLHGSGVVSWKDIVTPVAKLAEKWVISAQLSANLEEHATQHLLSGKFPELSKLYVKANGKIKTAGDIVEQPQLANTLYQIAEVGPSYIYDTMADTLAQEIEAAGGIVTAQDIQRYTPIVYAALESNFMGYRYIGAGGSSSGGAIVAGILNYMSSISQPLVSQGAIYYHRLVEAMKHGFAMRLHLADPEYVNTTEVVRALLSYDFMRDLQLMSPDDTVLPLSHYGGKYNMTHISPKDSGTTHLSVVDAQGNAVALTSTINTYFGSKVVSPSTGILFNNQMDDFSIPGASNYFGLAPSPYNYPAAYKRPLSSMSPSIVLDGHTGKVRMTGGASGGPKIITATLQVILNTLGLGMDPLSALIAPRQHSQLLPDKVDVEDTLLSVVPAYPSTLHITADESVFQALTSRGHNNVTRFHGGLGASQFITIDRDTGLIHAVSDPRKDGRPAGLTGKNKIFALAMAPGKECKPGVPCIFLGREPGWEPFEESASHSLTFPPRLSSNVNDSTIFLTMSSFRDRLCPSTLYYLYTKAAHPHRVHVGVVQQNTADDVDCLLKYCEMMKNSTQFGGSQGCPFEKNIRMMRVNAAEAKGPTWARSLGSKLMQDEEFCMQTDSHMNFVPDWDIHMIDMWALTNNEYAVLSTYVADSATLAENMPGTRGTNNNFEVPHLCMVTFSGGYGMVRNWGTKCLRNMHKPKMTNMVWGAGLSFSKCHAERKAPYDPHTPHIFDGEEFNRALRFWTWGYDIYTPHRVYVVHNYRDSQSDPKHMAWAFSRESQEQRTREVEAATLRLRMLEQMPPEANAASRAVALRGGAGKDSREGEGALFYSLVEVLALQQSRFGLGDRRSLDQAIAFSGIDTKRRVMVGNRCGNLDYVPFKEHPWGAEYIPQYDAISESFIDVRDPGSIYYDANSANMQEAWEKADRLHREGENHLSPTLIIDTHSLTDNAAATTIPALSENNVFAPVHFSIPIRESLPVEHHSGVEQHLMENKLAVNLICMFLIVCIIAGRICVQHRFKLRKTICTYLSLEDDADSSIKHV